MTEAPCEAAAISRDWKSTTGKIPAAGKFSSSRWNLGLGRFPVAVIFAALLALGSLVVPAARAAVVKEIAFEQVGLVPVDTNAVLAFTSIRLGQDITRVELTRDVDELKKSGRFSFVAAQIADAGSGVRVVYQLNQKPRITRIEVTGAEELGNTKVRTLLELGQGDLVDEATLEFRKLKVEEEYAKKMMPGAKVTGKIETDPLTGLCVVKITVDEGAKAHVRKISFPGFDDAMTNQHRSFWSRFKRNEQPVSSGRTTMLPFFSFGMSGGSTEEIAVKMTDKEALDADDLRDAMKQKKKGFWSFISGSGTYSPDDLDTDCETLRRMFQDRGMLDARVGPAQIGAQGKDYLDVEVPIRPGPVYRVGSVKVSGVTTNIYKPADVEVLVTNKTGQLASMSSLESTARALRQKYSGNGYIATRCSPVITPRADGSPVVDVEFQVTEGRKAYIGVVNIRGNKLTQDRVIRREISVLPDEPYSEMKLRTSENRLRGLGYFSFVGSTPQETADPGKYDINFDVEEQRTGNMLVGVGLSSIDNVMGFFELSQGNFNISDWPPTGAGQKLKLRGQIGSRRNDVDISFVEPWFLDRRLSLGVDLFRSDEHYSDDYRLLTLGGRVTLGRPLGAFNRLNLSYGLQNYDVYDVEDDASDIIKAEEGERLKSALTLELVRDTRDNPFIPTRGMRASASAQLAGGPLGADTDLYSFKLQATRYIPLWMDHVFSVRGAWFTVDHYGDSDTVPIFDRFFLGGARTIRGFKHRDVGPKDENEEPIGGLTSEMLSLEYTIPVVEKVRFAVFYDIGMVYEDAFELSTDALNSDWGLGVRFDVPGFPIRLDYAFPLETDEFNDGGGRFQFSIGFGQ